jgi:hypothetical protein
MRLLLRLTHIVGLSVLLLGCSVNVTDVQRIEISLYDDDKLNIKLAEDLMYYNGGYIAHHVLSLDEKTAKGIKLGYFVRSSDNTAFYQITYRLDNAAVLANHSNLQDEFESFIPRLAELHVEKEPVFEALKPMGRQVARDFYGDDPGAIWDSSSELLKSRVSRERFLELATSLKETYGEIASLDWLRGQYYQAFQGQPETISLFFKLEFENGKSNTFRTSVMEGVEEKSLVGFGVQPL